MDEIEMKLSLAPEDIDRLRRHALLRQLRKGRAATRMLHSVYFDTPEFDLRRTQLSLRVRRVGGHHVQTVKTTGERLAGLFSRGEWERRVPGETPDTALLAEAGFADLADAGQLRPIFATEVRRTIYLLDTGSCAVEMALDRGEVTANGQRAPICELELELRQGQPSDLFDLALRIQEIVPARILTTSKSERGYALASGAAPRPHKAKAAAMKPDLTVAEAFQRVARNCLQHLLSNEDSLLIAHDPEAIHQMRVALRRFRSALVTFEPIVATPQMAELKDEMRWLLGELGPARDADVFISEIVDPVLARFPDHPGMKRLRKAFSARQESARRAALDAVGSPRFTALLLRLAAWIEAGDWLATGDAMASEPVAGFACDTLDRRDRKLRKIGRRLDRQSPEERHIVRIQGKRMRYAGEFFAPLFPGKRTKRFLATLSDLQDDLGALNDIAAAATSLTGAGAGRDFENAAGIIVGWHEARADRLLADALKHWRAYLHAPRFWQADS